MKEIEKLDIKKMSQIKKWKRDKNVWNKINELIDKIDELNFNSKLEQPKTNFKLYEEIKWKGLDWIIIGLDNDNIRLLLKDVIPRSILEEIIEDKWYLASDNDVIMSDNVRPPFNFEESYINTDILPEFLSYLDIEDRQGIADIDLLSKEEVENLPEEVKRCNDWYWTKSNYEGDSKYARVWNVLSTGGLDYLNVTGGLGLRPAVSLPLESFNLESDKCGA